MIFAITFENTLTVETHGRGNRYAEEEDIIKACSQMIEDFPHNSRPVFPELRSLSMSATYRQVTFVLIFTVIHI